MALSYPAAALVASKSKPAVTLWLAEDAARVFTLEEAGKYIESFPAVKDGKLAYEALLVAVSTALQEKHKAEHSSAQPTPEGYVAHDYNCAMRCVATFANAVMYEMTGKFYLVSYTLNGTTVKIGKDDQEIVIAIPADVIAEAREADLNESKELIEQAFVGALAEATISRGDSVIRNVVMMNAKSVNGAHGRLYSEKAMRSLAALSEGLPAYANHVRDRAEAFKPRDVRELIGRYRNVRFDAARQRVTGDFHVLPEQKWVLDLAENMSDVVGISPVSRGAVRVDANGVEIVEDIVAVRSADLVSDPATTKGLFEHRDALGTNPPAPTTTPEGTTVEKITIEAAIKALLESGEVGKTLVRVQFGFDKEQASLTESRDQAIAGKQTADEALKAEQEAHAATKKTLAETVAVVDGFKAKDAVAAKRGRLDQVIAESDLGKKYGKVEGAVSVIFVESLMSQEEAQWASLIEDRVKMLDGAKPSQQPTSAKKDETLTEDAGKVIPMDAYDRMRRSITG